jgi:glutathione S-transferase
VRAGVEDLESQMNTILPASGYLTGDQFTLADIYIGARLHERRNKGLTKKVDNYYLRLAGREAFKEAVA